MLKTLSVNELQPGMMITKVVEQHGPVKIRKVGMIKSEAMIKGLSEMGVSLVEIDESQSFGLADDEPVVESNLNTDKAWDKASSTATQRLMAREKQHSSVDRELSQQFHRSLFMPAIDEMPSKWRLYFQPYALLLVVVLCGFMLGVAAIQIPTWMAQPALTNNGETVAPTKDSAIQDSHQSAPEQSLAQNAQGGENTLGQEANQRAHNSPQSTSAINAQELGQSGEQIAQNPSQQAQAIETGAQTSQEEQADSAAQTDSIRRYESINGIVLDEGQRVLGYQADDDGQGAQASDSSNEMALSEGTQNEGRQNQNPQDASESQQAGEDDVQISQDLLRRVNQVAAALEAEQNLTDAQSGIPSQSSLGANQGASDPSSPIVGAAQPIAQERIVRIDQLRESLLTQMPSMSFSAHMFASNPQDRWVRVNGMRLGEGDFITDDLSIVAIESERIILSFKGEAFSMNALSDW